MAITENKIIHRFIRDIKEYREGGEYFAQVIPIDTQAYAIYPSVDESGIPSEEKIGVYYVFGDGIHTYMEICEGHGILESAKEYPVITKDTINNKIDTLLQGNNIIIEGEGSTRKISVPDTVFSEWFISSENILDNVKIGDNLEDLNVSMVTPILPNKILDHGDIVIFSKNQQLLVTAIDTNKYSGTIISISPSFPPSDDKIYAMQNGVWVDITARLS